MHTHVLLEVYCGLNLKNKMDICDLPSCCKSPKKTPSYQCVFDRCPYVAVTSCENTLCYIGTTSEAEELISFGGEMGDADFEIAEWKAICIDKINEAYDEFMHRKE